MDNTAYLYFQSKLNARYKAGEVTAKDFYKKSYVYARMNALYYINEYNNTDDDFRKLVRMQSKFNADGVNILLLNKQVESKRKLLFYHRDQLGQIGEIMLDALDGWQFYGATYEDLFTLCGCGEKTISEMRTSIEEGGTDFSTLVAIHCPDYKYIDDFYDMRKFAPLTHAAKECLIKRFEELRKANKEIDNLAREKMFELFPEIKDSAVIKTTDEFGNTIFTDLDGLPIE